jgi:hypothetical protein
VALAQTWPLELDAMSAMHDAIQNGIADRRVADEFVQRATGIWLVISSEPCRIASRKRLPSEVRCLI